MLAKRGRTPGDAFTMDLTFFGAVGGVTGSSFRLRANGWSVLFDCGLFQGRREMTRRANERFGFEPQELRAVVQSHAHIDHSGRLPLLVRRGFSGAIHATPATRDLAELLLLDSAQIQMKDAEFLNRRRLQERLRARRSGPARADQAWADLAWAQRERTLQDEDEPPFLRPHKLPRPEILPLYLKEDVRDTLRLFRREPYHQVFEPAPRLRCRFHDAGHILGSAWVEIEVQEGGVHRRLVFTGDYGRRQPILRDPEPLLPADIYISESTYGDRTHAAIVAMEPDLEAAVARLEARGSGRLLIPSFAVGRAQTILYFLGRILRRRKGTRVQVVVDSPLATEATRVAAAHPDLFDQEALAELELMRRGGPAMHLRFTGTVEESKALNHDAHPLVILSASGMCESGRILHHLAWNLGREDCEILIVGFQARQTLGRRLLEGAREVNVLGRTYAVRARVTPMLGFSAHADRDELLAALAPHAGADRRVFLVHGEQPQRVPLGRELRRRGFGAVELPSSARVYEL